MSYGYYETARTQYAQLIGELEVLEKASILKNVTKKCYQRFQNIEKTFLRLLINALGYFTDMSVNAVMRIF